MIEEIQDLLLEQLAAIPGVATVEPWEGDSIDDIMQSHLRTPALYVIYRGAMFDPYDLAGDMPMASMEYMIVLIAKNLKGRTAGASAGYTLIEGVRRRLINRQIGEYDFLRPVREDLLSVQGGLRAYGMIYQLAHVLWQA
jgi:phage gp37-like protein